MTKKIIRVDDEYDVGYRKPPKHSQFKKGQSGNPRGRPPLVEQHEWKNVLDKLLIEPITVVLPDGKKRQLTTLEALIKGAIRRALNGCTRHLKLILDGTVDRAIERHKTYVSESDRAYIEAVSKMAHQFPED